MRDFLSGAVTMSTVVVALFFLRFWRRTGDRLLAVFSLAFWLMALLWVIQAVVNVADDHAHYLYLLRLLAYLLIIYAIVDKNRAAARPRDHDNERRPGP